MARVKNQSYQNDSLSFFKLGFQLGVVSIYGYSIYYMSTSAPLIDGMNRVMNPLLVPYGKWQFLTFQCLIMQFCAHFLCLVSQFVSIRSLLRFRDFYFTTLALPISGVVVTIFWSVWHLVGREQIFPLILEEFHPSWLNHAIHTIILPINLIELYLVKHEYFPTAVSMPVLILYDVGYSIFLLYLRMKTGFFVYLFLDQMDAIGVASIIIGSAFIVAIFFLLGKMLSNVFHKSSTTHHMD